MLIQCRIQREYWIINYLFIIQWCFGWFSFGISEIGKWKLVKSIFFLRYFTFTACIRKSDHEFEINWWSMTFCCISWNSQEIDHWHYKLFCTVNWDLRKKLYQHWPISVRSQDIQQKPTTGRCIYLVFFLLVQHKHQSATGNNI